MNKKNCLACELLICLISTFVSATGYAAWKIETVDTFGDVGWYTAIALDSFNRPHISYYDKDETDLKYAKWNGSSWDIDMVDTAGGIFTSIAVDNNNYPHISYIAGGQVKYIKWDGSDWVTGGMPGYSVNTMYNTSIALDTNYYAHITYSYSGALRHAYYNGAIWTSESVTSSSTPTDSSLVMVGDNPYIAYNTESGDDLGTARWNGSSWVLDPPPLIAERAYWPSLGIDSSNNPHISFLRFTVLTPVKEELRYAKWNGSLWNNQLIDDSVNDVGWWNSLALDSGDHAHISYHDNTNWDLKYATDKSGSWVIHVVDAIGGVGYCTSIKLDSSGNPHIAYYDVTNKDLKYARYIPGNYTISGYIKDNVGDPLSAVAVYLTGDARSNYITASDGYFEFLDLPSANYTITPSLAGWAFSPYDRSYSPLNSSQANQDFTGGEGTGWFIRGYVTEPEGTPVSNVLISLQGGAVSSWTTGADGYYEFINLSTGTYTVTPTKNGWVFMPENYHYASFDSDKDSQNFLGVPENTSCFIRGYIKDSSAMPIKGVTVNLSGDKTANFTTGVNGYYEFLELPFGNYTVTPQMSGWSFSPVSRSYEYFYKDWDSQDFLGIYGEINIQGDIKILGNLFNPNKEEMTTIWYDITAAGQVVIKIYTIDGILVKKLVDGYKYPGTYTQIWKGLNNNGEIVASGIYIVYINAPGLRRMKKVCVLK